MAVETKIDVDATEVIALFQRLYDRTPDIMVKGLNDAAHLLRTRWRDVIKTSVKQPVTLTNSKFNVDVIPGKVNFPEATVQLGPVVNTYLRYIVEGLIRKKPEIATVHGQTLSPVKAKLSRGDLPFGPAHWLGKIPAGEVKSNPNSFIGHPNGSTRRAVYQRMKFGKLKLLAVFGEHIQYKKSVPLDSATAAFKEDYFRILSERVSSLVKDVQ